MRRNVIKSIRKQRRSRSATHSANNAAHAVHDILPGSRISFDRAGRDLPSESVKDTTINPARRQIRICRRTQEHRGDKRARLQTAIRPCGGRREYTQNKRSCVRTFTDNTSRHDTKHVPSRQRKPKRKRIAAVGESRAADRADAIDRKAIIHGQHNDSATRRHNDIRHRSTRSAVAAKKAKTETDNGDRRAAARQTEQTRLSQRSIEARAMRHHNKGIKIKA